MVTLISIREGAMKFKASTNLLKTFSVEQDEHFLVKAKEYLDGVATVGRLYCAGLQNFKFPANSYDVIWFQWVLGHLTDDHLVQSIVYSLNN